MDEIRVNDLASRFAAVCGDAHVEAGDGIGPRYQSDWLGKTASEPAIVVRPASTGEVAGVMKICAETRTPVIPFGGNSGLACGTIARAEDQVVMLSLERMNRVRRIDAPGRYMVADRKSVV